MHTNVNKIMKVMENLAPPHLAESWDNVGLMVGNSNKMVENILVCLEVTEAVIDEAVAKNVDLIIAHHPLIYKSVKKITTQDPITNMVIRLIQNEINLYVAHTNLDVATLGTSKCITDLLGLSRVDYITKHSFDEFVQLQTFVPTEHEEALKKALFSVGAGKIGNYDECSFSTVGEGQFKPLEGSDPFIGDENVLEKVNEVKLEMTFEAGLLSKVEAALLKHHPYETPAYSMVKLENKQNGQGIGMYGYLDKSITLEELSLRVKDLLKCESVKLIGDLNKKVSRIGVITGSGADYYKAVKACSDVLITGDIKYHEAQTALQLKLPVIDAGHYETEIIYIKTLKNLLDQRFEEKSYDINVIESEIDINPFKTL
jgi:dinuclear metal center YbgI/SA1388 family protein